MGLRARVEQLIHVTGWPEEKQKLWLAKQGVESWGQCSVRVLKKAVEKLEMSARMFGLDIAAGSVLVHDKDETDGLRVYTED